ncbi:MAG: thioredoxin family protein [Myxococcota bacterium]|nr:thioredoxin family protein [Myxococcota bacterium]
MPSAFKSITAEDYPREVLAQPGGVVVFFWSPQSAPCRLFIAPLEQFAATRARRPKLVKVNVDEHAAAARQAKLGGVPALLAYRDGQVVGQLIGTGTPREVEAVFAQAD